MGHTVAASFQTPTLFLIASDLTRMEVDTNVSESDIGGIREGSKASFTVDAFPRRTFEGGGDPGPPIAANCAKCRDL
jgi:HlyD family secretion protein